MNGRALPYAPCFLKISPDRKGRPMSDYRISSPSVFQVNAGGRVRVHDEIARSMLSATYVQLYLPPGYEPRDQEWLGRWRPNIRMETYEAEVLDESVWVIAGDFFWDPVDLAAEDLRGFYEYRASILGGGGR